MRPVVNGVTTNFNGYPASWSPADDSELLYSEMVHKKTMTFKQRMELSRDEVDYNPRDFFIQYTEDQFPGLYELANSHVGREEITVDGILYSVQQAVRIVHGKAIVLKLLPIERNGPIYL